MACHFVTFGAIRTRFRDAPRKAGKRFSGDPAGRGKGFKGIDLARARIYKPAKNAMQSGRARTRRWVLEFEPRSARRVEPLMGWTSSGDMNAQVTLRFDTKEEAIAYAEKHGIDFQLYEPKKQPVLLKSYSDNFKFGRSEPWTH